MSRYRAELPPEKPEYKPGPCPRCGKENGKELGQYLNGPPLTVIRCPDCGLAAHSYGSTIEESQAGARRQWAEPLYHNNDENAAAGLLEEE